MTPDAARKLMVALALQEFPYIGGRTKKECTKLCEAFTILTGRKATLKEVRTAWTGDIVWKPEIEQGE